jgi:cytochrome c heme-lyase
MGGGLSKHQDEIKASASEAIHVSSSTAETMTMTMTPPKEPTSACPMHNADGSYNFDWRSLFKAAAVHGPSGSKPLPKEDQEKARQTVEESSSSGGCPVKADTRKVPPPQEGGCPVKHDHKNSQFTEYNVYSQPIDKTNQMPNGVKTQLPSSTQRSELSTNRVSSTIPKGATESDTWTFPSPQQFYNALVRKGKLDNDTSEEDMESVVALHNNMNEKTWAKVVEWEQQIYDQDAQPKLLKFLGRPHDLSPKAGLKHYLLGHPLPYDRHDWTVLRGDGNTVRYVIDYYYDETRAQESADSGKPELHNRNATPSLLVDVRPALDGPSEFVARAVQMPFKIYTQQTAYEPLPLRGTTELATQVKESIQVWQSIQESRQQQLADEAQAASMKFSQAEAKEIATNFAKALKDCRTSTQKVEQCESDEECGRASMDLTMCMGKLLCQVQHKSIMASLQGNDDAKIEAALETLTECVGHQTGRRHEAKEQYPNEFK